MCAKRRSTGPAEAGGMAPKLFQQRYPAGYLPVAYSADEDTQTPRSRTVGRRCLRPPGVGARGCIGAGGWCLEIPGASVAHRSAIVRADRDGRSEVPRRGARHRALEARRVAQAHGASAFHATRFPVRSQHDQRGAEVQARRAPVIAACRALRLVMALCRLLRSGLRGCVMSCGTCASGSRGCAGALPGSSRARDMCWCGLWR